MYCIKRGPHVKGRACARRVLKQNVDVYRLITRKGGTYGMAVGLVEQPGLPRCSNARSCRLSSRFQNNRHRLGSET